VLQNALRASTRPPLDSCKREWSPPLSQVHPKTGWVHRDGTLILSLEAVSNGYVVRDVQHDDTDPRTTWIDQSFVSCMEKRFSGLNVIDHAMPSSVHEGDRQRMKFPYSAWKRWMR